MYVIRHYLGGTLYGEVEEKPPGPEELEFDLPDLAPPRWLVGQWYSTICSEGEWGRVDPRQPGLQEISREHFERARAQGWVPEATADRG